MGDVLQMGHTNNKVLTTYIKWIWWIKYCSTPDGVAIMSLYIFFEFGCLSKTCIQCNHHNPFKQI